MIRSDATDQPVFLRIGLGTQLTFADRAEPSARDSDIQGCRVPAGSRRGLRRYALRASSALGVDGSDEIMVAIARVAYETNAGGRPASALAIPIAC